MAPFRRHEIVLRQIFSAAVEDNSQKSGVAGSQRALGVRDMRTFVCPVRDVPRCHCFCHMRTSASARGDRVGVPEPRSSEGFCQDSAVSTRTSCKLWSRTAGLPEELDSTVHDACVTSARSSWEFGFPALPAAPGGLRPGRGFDVWHVPAASGPPWTPASQRGPQCVGHTHPARLSQGLLVPGTAEPLQPFGSFGWNVCTPRLGRKGDPRACRVCVRPPFVRCRELLKR